MGSQLILIGAAGKVNPVVTIRHHDWGRTLKCRQAVVKFHEYEMGSNSMLTMISSISTGILNSMKITTVLGLDPESVSDFSNYGPFILGSVPKSGWDKECPMWVLWSDWPSQLKIHLVKKTLECMHLAVTSEGEGGWPCTIKPYMSTKDYEDFEACEVRAMTRRVENLCSWANNNVETGNSRIIFLHEKNSLCGENWDLISSLLEASSPGRSAHIASLMQTGAGT